LQNGDYTSNLQGHMRTLLAYLETPVMITSGNYKTAYVNPAFEQAFVVEFRDTIGKDIYSFLPPSSAEVLIEAGETTRNQGASQRFILRQGAKYFSVGVSSVSNEEGRVTGVVYNFTDVTKEHQLEQVKADFISLILNDLRNPLFQITKNFDDIKKELDKSSPLLSLVEEGIENSNDVLENIEQYLHVTASISGHLELTKSEIDPEILLSTAVASLRKTAAKSNVTLEHFSLKRLPTWSCDRDKMLQVFICMITEQIKAGGTNGTVSVGIDASLKGDKPDKLFISAAQPNKYVERDDLPELLGEPVPGGSSDPTRIAIKKIIDAHDGIFSLVGVEGYGSSLTVAFPYMD